MRSRVDVLIPAVRPDNLPIALASLADQTVRDFRVLVGDFSTKGVLSDPKVAAAAERLRGIGIQVEVEHDPGRSWGAAYEPRYGPPGFFVSSLPDARRRLLARAEAPLVLSMDDDIALGPDFLADATRTEATWPGASYYVAFPVADGRLWFNPMFFQPVSHSPRAETWGFYCHFFCVLAPREHLLAIRAYEYGENDPCHDWDRVVALQLIERFGLPRLIRSRFRHRSAERFAAAPDPELGGDPNAFDLALLAPPFLSRTFGAWLARRHLIPGLDTLPPDRWPAVWECLRPAGVPRAPEWEVAGDDLESAWSAFAVGRGMARHAHHEMLLRRLIERPEALPGLSARAGELDAYGRYLWVQGLSALRGASVSAALRPNLDDPDDGVHWRALDALVRAGDAPSRVRAAGDPDPRALGDALIVSHVAGPDVDRLARECGGATGVLAASLIAAAPTRASLRELWADRAALHPDVRLAIGYLSTAGAALDEQAQLVRDYLAEPDESLRHHLLGGWAARYGRRDARLDRHAHLPVVAPGEERARFVDDVNRRLASSTGDDAQWLAQLLARLGVTRGELAARSPEPLAEDLAAPRWARLGDISLDACNVRRTLEGPPGDPVRHLLFRVGALRLADHAPMVRALLERPGVDGLTRLFGTWALQRTAGSQSAI